MFSVYSINYFNQIIKYYNCGFSISKPELFQKLFSCVVGSEQSLSSSNQQSSMGCSKSEFKRDAAIWLAQKLESSKGQTFMKTGNEDCSIPTAMDPIQGTFRVSTRSGVQLPSSNVGALTLL